MTGSGPPARDDGEDTAASAGTTGEDGGDGTDPERPETAPETDARGVPGAAEPDPPEAETSVEPDPETRDLLRAVARDVRGDTSESEQVAAVLYRVSDLYDPEADTSAEEIYLNVRAMWQVKARGGLER